MGWINQHPALRLSLRDEPSTNHKFVQYQHERLGEEIYLQETDFPQQQAPLGHLDLIVPGDLAWVLRWLFHLFRIRIHLHGG